MAIDVVHDLQEVYRQVLHSMSRPGCIENIQDKVAKCSYHLSCYDSTMLMAMMLLDAEVTFHVVSEKGSELTNQLAELTLAKQKNVREADYIFITRDAPTEMIKDVLQLAKVGSLTNPQASATIIMETAHLSNDSSLYLTGPGIKSTYTLFVDGAEVWLDIRASVNKEYPLGIDIICVDEAANIACLPRTTKMSKLEMV